MPNQLYKHFYSPKNWQQSKENKKDRKQTQMNLTNMQLYSNFTAQPGLKVIKKINIALRNYRPICLQHSVYT